MALGKLCGYVLMAVCLVAIAAAFNYDRVLKMTIDNSPEYAEKDSDTIQLDKAMKTLEQMRQLLDATEMNGDCSCTGLTCECCQDIEIRKIHFHEKCCLTLTFRPETGTAIVAVKIGHDEVFKKEFQVSRPISTCFKLPEAEVCLDFHDFHLDSKTLSGCSRLIFKVFHHKIGSFELGCFHISFLDSFLSIPSGETSVVDAPAAIEAFGALYVKNVIPIDVVKPSAVKDNEI